MDKNDRADTGRVPRGAAHEANGSAATVAPELLPPQFGDPLQTTERDASPLRLPDELPATQDDGTLLYEFVAHQQDDGRDPDSAAWAGRLTNVPGYEVLAELGRGGMGVVYRARQVLLDRPCAIKMILTECSHDPHAVARFLYEAQADARLRHPNIVEIYGIGEFRGRPYLVLAEAMLAGHPLVATRRGLLEDHPEFDGLYERIPARARGAVLAAAVLAADRSDRRADRARRLAEERLSIEASIGRQASHLERLVQARRMARCRPAESPIAGFGKSAS